MADALSSLPDPRPDQALGGEQAHLRVVGERGRPGGRSHTTGPEPVTYLGQAQELHWMAERVPDSPGQQAACQSLSQVDIVQARPLPQS